MANTYDIFISYHFETNNLDDWVEFFCKKLKIFFKNNVADWDPYNQFVYLKKGTESKKQIEYKIKNKVTSSRSILCILSPAYFSRPWCKYEVKCFKARGAEAIQDMIFLGSIVSDEKLRDIPGFFTDLFNGRKVSEFWYGEPSTPIPIPIGNSQRQMPAYVNEKADKEFYELAWKIRDRLYPQSDGSTLNNKELRKVYFHGTKDDFELMKKTKEKLKSDKLKCYLPLRATKEDALAIEERKDRIEKIKKCDYVVMFYFDDPKDQINTFCKSPDYKKNKSKRESPLREVLIMREGEHLPKSIDHTKLYKLLLTNGSDEDCVKKLKEVLQ